MNDQQDRFRAQPKHRWPAPCVSFRVIAEARKPKRTGCSWARASHVCRIWPRMLSAVVLLLILIGLPETRGTLGQVQGLNREHMLKAVYLYKFATYIRWPDEAFSSSTSPFVIGVLGPDPVGVHLRKIAAVKNINGRKIELRTYETPDEVRDCHILFMSRGLDNENQSSAVRQLSRRNILFVGEDNSFLERGGVVDFVVHENRIRVLISRSAYEREGLKISAQLLRVAEVVD